MNKSKGAKPRYSGTDSQPWKVADHNGKNLLKTKEGNPATFDGFKQANGEARKLRAAFPGLTVNAVRA